MTSARIITTREEALGLITLENPPLNLVNLELLQALDRALDEFIADPGVRVLMVRGSGERAFCAGSDLRQTLELKQRGAFVAEKLAFETAVFQKLARAGKPTVAAVAGAALGGGLELAASCDLIVASTTAKLGLPEIHIGGFPPTGAVRIARRIGLGRTRRLILTGQPIDAATAYDWGLVDHVASPGETEAAARDLATTLAQRPPRAMQAAKMALEAACDFPEADALSVALGLADFLARSPDGLEGARAFLEKRAPVWRDQPFVLTA